MRTEERLRLHVLSFQVGTFDKLLHWPCLILRICSKYTDAIAFFALGIRNFEGPESHKQKKKLFKGVKLEKRSLGNTKLSLWIWGMCQMEKR